MLIGGNQTLVTGAAPDFDDTAAGKAARLLYTPAVETIGRQFGWDFARSMVALALTGNVAPSPWAYEYVYPDNGVQIWQLYPGTIVDPFDPLPNNFAIGNTLVSGQQQRVIWAQLVDAKAAYNNNPTEDTWDAGFREAVVRLLASELAMALSGKPETSSALLQSSSSFLGAAEDREN